MGPPLRRGRKGNERLEMDRPKISVVVITKNESDRIERFLKSAAWADEVIVVDDESTDNTRQICEEFGAKVIVNKIGRKFSPAKKSWDTECLRGVDIADGRG